MAILKEVVENKNNFLYCVKENTFFFVFGIFHINYTQIAWNETAWFNLRGFNELTKLNGS